MFKSILLEYAQQLLSMEICIVVLFYQHSTFYEVINNKYNA